ncbi:MAG: pyrimidine 5'-nucleotidase [Anaerolineae bacterium]
MSLTHIIFDLDDTLYPRQAGLMEEIAHRITRWIERTLDLTPEEAAALRQSYLQKYGTTLGGLRAEHQVDVAGYLAFVHDIPIGRYVRPRPALAEMLRSIPLRKVVFTNATSEHACRVLRALDVADQFEHVIGIREVDLYHKPRLEGYKRLLELLDSRGPGCVLVEDRAVNLRPGKRLGMTTVLVDAESEEGVDFVVSDVLEVGPLVTRLVEGRDD